MKDSFEEDFVSTIKEIISDEKKQNLKLIFEDELGPIHFTSSDLSKVLGMGGVKNTIDTTKGSIAKIAQKGKSLLKFLKNDFKTLFFPLIKSSFEKIKEDESRVIKTINDRYPGVIKNVSKIFTTDAAVIGFLLDPIVSISTLAAHASEDKIAELLKSIATYEKNTDEGLATQLFKLASRQFKHENTLKLSSILNEAESENILQQTNVGKSVIELLKKSTVIKNITDETRSIYNEFLTDVIEIAQKIKNAESAKQISANVNAFLLKHAGEDEDSQRLLLQSFKEMSISSIIDLLKKKLNEFEKGNVDKSSKLFVAFARAIDQLSDNVE